MNLCYELHSLTSVSTFMLSEWIFDFQHCPGSVAMSIYAHVGFCYRVIQRDFCIFFNEHTPLPWWRPCQHISGTQSPWGWPRSQLDLWWHLVTHARWSLVTGYNVSNATENVVMQAEHVKTVDTTSICLLQITTLSGIMITSALIWWPIR